MAAVTPSTSNSAKASAAWQPLDRAQRLQRLGVGLAAPLVAAATPLLLAADSRLPLHLNLGCGFLALTGWPCPLCGGTHACAALVQGDWAAAWAANPGALGLLLVLALLALQWALEGAAGWRRSRAWPWGGAAAARWVAGGLLLSWALALARLW